MARHEPLHIERVIVPCLREARLSQTDIDTLLIANPRRFCEQAHAAGACQEH